MKTNDPLAVLRHEFNAEDGSFLLCLRSGPGWNREAFSRLIAAMQEYLESVLQSESIERWIAQGFWYLERTVGDCLSHPSFQRPYGQSYYEKAYARLSDLAYWLFSGESPDLSGTLEPWRLDQEF